jgi:hypothetical protein
MPGLLRGIARTAVIAGTASAVSGRVQRRQAEHFAGRDAHIYAQQQQAYAQQAPAYAQQAPAYAAPPPQPAAPSQSDLLAQLQQLGDLKKQGILTEAEFSAQKAKILAS